MGEKMRLDKFVSAQISDVSRSMVRDMCKKGRIKINGAPAKKSDEKIDIDTDYISLDDKGVTYRKHMYIMLNKPQGVVCSTKDGESKTVIELVPDELMRVGLFPAGRLDKDTEGFVLLTDDGELSHKMLSPKSHVPKRYFVRLEKEWQEDYKEKFSSGLEIDGGDICLPAEFYGDSENLFECEVVLHEGKYHQVKRMFAKLGNSVVYLKRTMIGELPIDENLQLGECLEIMHKDVERLLTG